MLVYIKPITLFQQLRSDTLFGAICSAISELYPEKIDEIINDFEEKPPFLISSAFPYIYNEKKIIRFYPKINRITGYNEFDSLKIKKYKSIQYFEEEIFMDLITGKTREEEIMQNLDEYYTNYFMLMKKDPEIDFRLSNRIIPGNTINRINNSSENIYYTNGIDYTKMGLYFFIKFIDMEYVDIIKSALKYLKDLGFGKDISIGKGQFDYTMEENKIESELYENSGNYFVTLSRYIPTIENIENINNESAYEIESKRGRSSRGEIRKQVRFFTEGSTFNHIKEKENYGQIVHSGVHSPAVEYGYAFPIKFNRGI